MVQNINKITTNTGSVILWNNDSIIVSIPKGMYYCHMIDGIVKIKQIAVENIFNIVKTSSIDGETFPIVEDMLNKLSSFSRGGGTGAGGAKAYENLAEAMSETPLPSNGTMFYVPEGSPDSGIYAYDSENINGYYKVSDLPEKGFNGWTPIHVFESDGAQRQVKKLTDYIGGTGDKPTQNIGQYVLDGGYTADKSLATNFKGATGDTNWGIKNITEADFLNVGSIASSSGTVINNVNYKHTNRYKVSVGMQFKNNPGVTFASGATCAFYNNSGNFVSAVSMIASEQLITSAINGYVIFSKRFEPAPTDTTVYVTQDFWALQQDILIAEYIHSGNKEVVVQSIDYTTNTFTSAGHGLSTGDKLIIVPKFNCSIGNEIPFNQDVPSGSAISSVGYFVINSSANTFQIGSSSTAIISLTDKGTNFNNWQFEQITELGIISFTNIGGLDKLRVLINGVQPKLLRYVSPINNINVGVGFRTSVLSQNTTALEAAGILRGVVTTDVYLTNGQVSFVRTVNGIRFGAGNQVNIVSENYNAFALPPSSIQGINIIQLNTFAISNGSKIQLIKL